MVANVFYWCKKCTLTVQTVWTGLKPGYSGKTSATGGKPLAQFFSKLLQVKMRIARSVFKLQRRFLKYIFCTYWIYVHPKLVKMAIISVFKLFWVLWEPVTYLLNHLTFCNKTWYAGVSWPGVLCKKFSPPGQGHSAGWSPPECFVADFHCCQSQGHSESLTFQGISSEPVTQEWVSYHARWQTLFQLRNKYSSLVLSQQSVLTVQLTFCHIPAPFPRSNDCLYAFFVDWSSVLISACGIYGRYGIIYVSIEQ